MMENNTNVNSIGQLSEVSGSLRINCTVFRNFCDLVFELFAHSGRAHVWCFLRQLGNMASAVAQCQEATSKLQGLVQSGELEKAQPIIRNIKLLLIKFKATAGVSPSDNAESAAEVGAGVAALETFIVHSVKARDDKAFARYFSQLRSFYSMTTLEATPNQPKMLGLNLVRLLVGNDLASFHSELELVPQACVTSPFVLFPVELERSLMEGMYNQVLNARKKFPDPLFSEYLGPLEDAVRDEISQCAAASYPSLSLDAAQKLFNFSTREELLEYCADNEEWVVDGDRVRFPEKHEARVGREDLPSRRTIGEVLSFAGRLEQIV